MTLETKRKKFIFRTGSLALIILLFSVLQNTDNFFPQIFGVRALLLIPIVVCASMFERDVAGMVLGLFAGALWDIFASGTNMNALFLLTVGFICGTLINTIMRNNIVTATILGAAFSFAYNILYWAIHYISVSLDGALSALLRFYLPSSVYTALLTPVVFIIVRAVEKKFPPND